MENITGNPVTHKNYLKTRLFLVRDLKKLLRKCSVIIEAPRRFGKTSVIKEFINREDGRNKKSKEFNIIFLELEGEETVNAFCFKLFKELLKLYQLRKRVDRLSEFFGKSWDALVSRLKKIKVPGIEVELREKTRDLDFTKWKEKINPLITGLDAFDRKKVIIFDEFPDMLMNFKNKGKEPVDFEDAVDSLTAWLRSLRQQQKRGSKCRFVFCGSINLRKTLESMGIGKRINDLEPFVIPVIEEHEAGVLIESLAKKYGIEIEPDGIKFMVSKITDGSPYYGQILFKALREDRGKVFETGKVKAVYDTMLRGGCHDLNHFHTRLETYLSPLEKECSSALLRQLCEEASHEKELYDLCFFDRCSVEIFQAIVNRLIYEGYLLRDADDKGKLRFVSPVLKDWWACKTGVL